MVFYAVFKGILVAADHRNTKLRFSEANVVAKMWNDLFIGDYNLYSDFETENEEIDRCSLSFPPLLPVDSFDLDLISMFV